MSGAHGPPSSVTAEQRRVNRLSLDPLFAPRSVAVIGASRDPSKVGGSVLANLRSGGFEGRVIPINSRADVVQGLAAAPCVSR